jgi:hypothetical protein
MSVREIRSIALDILSQIARSEEFDVAQQCPGSRITTEELRQAILEYGRTLVAPPPDAYDAIYEIQVSSKAMPIWAVTAPMWTLEEGRSDLSLEMTIELGPAGPKVQLDDLHVM